MALEAEGLITSRATTKGHEFFDYADTTPDDPDDDCEEAEFEQDEYYDHKKSSILREEIYNQVRDPIQNMLNRGSEFMRYLTEDKNLTTQDLGIIFYGTADSLFDSAYNERDIDWDRFVKELTYNRSIDRFSSGVLFPSIILKAKTEGKT
jgi:hypothetical protein